LVQTTQSKTHKPADSWIWVSSHLQVITESSVWD
jgi:hypothetical protein